MLGANDGRPLGLEDLLGAKNDGELLGSDDSEGCSDGWVDGLLEVDGSAEGVWETEGFTEGIVVGTSEGSEDGDFDDFDFDDFDFDDLLVEVSEGSVTTVEANGDPVAVGDSVVTVTTGDSVATVEADGDPVAVGDSVATDTTDDVGYAVTTVEADGDPVAVGDSVVKVTTGDSVATVEADGNPVGDSVAFTDDGELVGEVVTTAGTGARVMIELVGDPVLSAVGVIVVGITEDDDFDFDD